MCTDALKKLTASQETRHKYFPIRHIRSGHGEQRGKKERVVSFSPVNQAGLQGRGAV